MCPAFASMNDAARLSRRLECLRPGTTKIWYLASKTPTGRDERRVNIALGQFEDINPADLSETHVLMGSIAGGDLLDEVFMALQGEFWSPDGQARGLIERLGGDHTSMSVGDIIEREDGLWVVAAFGFEHLGAEVAALA